MKKILILLMAPLLLAMQCDDDTDDIVGTEYFIENNSSVDLRYFNFNNDEITIASNTSVNIGLAIDEDDVIPPSGNTDIPNIILFAINDIGEQVQVYTQDPIDDSLWQIQTESDVFTFYELVITDELLE